MGWLGRPGSLGGCFSGGGVGGRFGLREPRACAQGPLCADRYGIPGVGAQDGYGRPGHVHFCGRCGMRAHHGLPPLVLCGVVGAKGGGI